MSDIQKIIMYRENGMYRSDYDVKYVKQNGSEFWRRYTIKGTMIDKHFDFIMSHDSTRIYTRSGKHTQDVWE